MALSLSRSFCAGPRSSDKRKSRAVRSPNPAGIELDPLGLRQAAELRDRPSLRLYQAFYLADTYPGRAAHLPADKLPGIRRALVLSQRSGPLHGCPGWLGNRGTIG